MKKRKKKENYFRIWLLDSFALINMIIGYFSRVLFDSYTFLFMLLCFLVFPYLYWWLNERERLQEKA